MNKKCKLLIPLLTLGVFGIINTEMGIIGILPLIARQFNVSVPSAGLLVSGFALVVAFAGPTMPLFFSKMNRKHVMMLSLGIFVMSNILSMFAPSFEVLLLARIIPAAFQPIYVSMAFTVASNSVEQSQSTKAIAKIFMGVSAGMVLGVPITSFVANSFSFSLAMGFYAFINGLVLIATILLIPSMPVTNHLTYSKQIGILKRPMIWLSIGIVILLNGAIFGFFSFLSNYLETITGLSTIAITIFLLIYGLTNILGNLIAGRMLTYNASSLLFALPVLLIASYLALFLFGNISVLSFIIVSVLGVLAGAVGNANQYLISTAGSEAPDFSNGLFLTAANLGTTIGTSICGLLISSMGTKYSLFGAILFLTLSFIGIIIHNLCSGTRFEI